MSAQTLINSCLDILFPPRCGVCNVHLRVPGGDAICDECRNRLRPLEDPVCCLCGMEVYAGSDRGTICGECLKSTPPFELARSLFHYGEELRVLLAGLKYRRDTSVIAVLGELIQGCELSIFQSCDYVVPVPLHKKRLQQRGFNQSLLLAKILFQHNDPRIVANLLRRTRNTVPQVSLDGKERRKSLRNVFKVNPGVDISGATICLVDDVYTTGTTVSECSRGLLRGGAGRVLVLTLARVEVPRRGRSAAGVNVRK